MQSVAVHPWNGSIISAHTFVRTDGSRGRKPAEKVSDHAATSDTHDVCSDS